MAYFMKKRAMAYYKYACKKTFFEKVRGFLMMIFK